MILETQLPNPDALFWYSICGVLFLLLSGFASRWLFEYLKETKEFTKSVTETLQRLVTNDAVKEERLTRVEENIESIKDKIYPINYKSKRQ